MALQKNGKRMSRNYKKKERMSNDLKRYNIYWIVWYDGACSAQEKASC